MILKQLDLFLHYHLQVNSERRKKVNWLHRSVSKSRWTCTPCFLQQPWLKGRSRAKPHSQPLGWRDGFSSSTSLAMVVLHRTRTFLEQEELSKKLLKSAFRNEIFGLDSQDATRRSASRYFLKDVEGRGCCLPNRENGGRCLFTWLGGWLPVSQTIFLVIGCGGMTQRGVESA